MADLGKPKRTIEVVPLEPPVPREVPVPEPKPIEEPDRVPAKAS